jgi:hypothetical protein
MVKELRPDTLSLSQYERKLSTNSSTTGMNSLGIVAGVRAFLSDESVCVTHRSLSDHSSGATALATKLNTKIVLK